MSQNDKLDKNNIENFMSLTSLQQGMLFHYINDENSSMYYEQLSLTIRGDVKLDLLQEAWNIVIENNEMLRTIFRWKGINEPIQIVLKKHEIEIKYSDITNISDKENLIKRAKEDDIKNRIDITRETLRINLFKLDENLYEMTISNHHILYDGWSNGIILEELMEAYNCLYANKEPKKSIKTKFSQFIKYLNLRNKEEEKEYWSKYLDNIENKDDFFSCKEIGTYEEIVYKIDNTVADKIKNFSKENKVLLSSILYGAWGILLQKLNNTNEIVFGTIVSGRTENISQIDKMVGLFINTIPLRVKTDEEANLIELIKFIDRNLSDRKSFENTSLIDIKDYCGVKAKEELFNTIVAIENYPLNLSKNKENVLHIEDFSIIEQTNYNMSLEILSFEEIEFKFKFNSVSIDKGIADKIGQYIERIIKYLINDSNCLVRNIDLLSEAEKNQILYEFNNTKADYPKDKTIHELFEAQVEKTPDNIALVFEDKNLTYRELNERANSLARALRDKGVKADSIVGIMVERSPEMIMGIMGILKAGGAYLPIDPSYPKERIQYMLEDSEAKILLSEESLLQSIEFEGIIIDLYKEELYKNDTSNLEKINTSNNLAYVIYTSGSTGNPKGVLVEHKSVVRLVKNTNYIEFKPNDKILQTGSMVFDASTFEVWGSLLNGLELHLAKNETIMMPQSLEELLIKNNISILWLTSELFNQMAETNINIFRGLRYLLVGGDILSPKYINAVREKFSGLKIINGYGPTENTTFSTTYLIKDISFNIPIGRPISNTKAYIVNKNNRLNPVGIYGELCLSGAGLARGYLNREELTKEKFVDNPFEPGTKMYKTGDLARWMSDGNIEFLGRVDNQVKIRGFRIELGEIESRILQHEKVKAAAVVVKENKSSEKYICAYIVSEDSLEELNLKNYLKEKLPEYMIPSYFVQIEKMPLTSNGKLDRRQLPEPDMELISSEYEAPRNEVEKSLAKIWSEVLGIERVGINDNFFDLGGHSLKATVLVSKIHKELSREIPLKELFRTPTIKELSKYIEKAEENIYSNIEKIEEKEYYEASSAQKRMYILQQFDKYSTAYNMPMVLELEGEINKNKIEETFKELSKRHEALRTYFETVDGEIVQKIQSDYEFKLEQREENIENAVKNFIRPFELEKAPLLRAELVEDKEKVYLLVDMHHIISDGVSMSIITNEFAQIYNGKKPDELKLQYKDFAVWQNKFLKTEEMKKQEEYWINEFSDEIPVLNMPTDYERPAVQSFEGDSVDFEISEEVTSKLRKLTKETGTTMHMALLSAFNILLSRYSVQEDIVIGTPIAGRPHADLENIMGMFVNTIALRNKPEGEKRYIDFLKEVKENSLRAYENQSYQFEELVEKLNIRRDTSRNPLFDVMFNMIDTVDGEDIKLEDIILKPYRSENKVSKFDLTLNALEKDRKLSFTIDYCSKLFKKETIERLSNHYIKLLDSIADNTEIKLGEVDLLSEAEKNQILYEFNDTKADYPKEKTIHELFEAQAENTPDNIAVVFEDKNLTYKELNERANSLARSLRDKGVKADSIVGIMVERSLEMIIGIMGILKAGGAYLPIDPSYPTERIEYMLKDSETRILLSEEALLENVELKGIAIDLYKEELYKNDTSNLAKINNPNNLAYVIYTSGTTGNPKGVMIENKSIINQITGLIGDYGYGAMINHMLYAKTIFDVSVQHIFTALCSGATLHLMTDYLESDYSALAQYIKKTKVQFINMVPSQMEVFIDHLDFDCNNIRIILGAETLHVSLYKKIIKYVKPEEIYNYYGPTETTINALIYRCSKKEEGKTIPIGKPMRNYKAYILDKCNRAQPVGVYGELCISGDGLARGYLNKEELTKEKFVDNPFESGTKMYRTGDLVRWLPDGNIEFLGRIDNQVKIRGFRIELGEIESRILQHEKVKEAVVLVKENKEEEKYICAYIVSGNSLEELNLKNYLKEILPEYMIPSYFIQIEKMPLTPNGKLDRRQLPELDMELMSGEYEAPRNEVEEILSRIWSEVLGVERIGINDNFFNLGGHSLKATVLVSKIHKELNKEIPLKELFRAPTIKELSKYIEKAEENIYSNIEKIEEKEYYEASSAQKRMYILQQFDKESTAYNMPAVFELEGEADKNKIEETFRKLTQRHEALRTYFETIEGEVVQKIENGCEFKLEQREEQGNIEEIINNFVRPFELEKAPLFRVELAEDKEKVYLLVDMHHIISDGVSMSIITNEFAQLYNGKKPDELKLQYKDFAEWQNKFLKTEEMKKQEEYWINEFSDEIPVLNMPTDYERPAVQNHEGDSINFEISEEITSKLRKLTRETGTTMHMALLSAFNILLSKYSGQEDIVIGTPIAGRPHADLQNIMGMFVNTLALRNRPEREKRYIDFLKEVKENSLRAYENQSYQFEALVEKLNVRRDTSRNPIFDVTLNIVDTLNNKDIKLEDIILKPYNTGSSISKFDMTLNAIENGAKVYFSIVYCTKLFKKETIERISRHFIKVLDNISSNQEIKLADIKLLSEAEKNQILYEFNDTYVDYPKEKTIQELFEEQVVRTPDNIAVVFEEEKLTYKELNEKSNSIARELREKGVKADSIVGIMVERSLEMIIGIIGILKAGGAYLPIDPSYPKERIEYILRDSGSNILLSQDSLVEKVEFEGIVIDLYKEKLYKNDASNLMKINTSNNLAYVIYTSGTTGNPKGVMIEHRNLTNLILGLNNKIYYRYEEFLRVALVSPYYFDASVKQIFAAIVNGYSLYVVSEDTRRDGINLLDYYEKNKIHVSDGTPMHIKMMLGSNLLKNHDLVMKHFIIGGEVLLLNTIKELYENIESNNKPYISNVYGPTECCVDASIYTVNTETAKDVLTLPIGKPMPNYRIYIVDKNNNNMPIGIYGELCVSGEGLARGYLNKEELTKEKFVDNPFETGTKMYKTGDLARWMPDGNIEFLGRIDNQVKIRGFRIELSEIESRILQHEKVKEAAVLVKENKEEKYICAYIVSENSLEELKLKNYLKEILPEYMIPSYFVQIEKMPLTSNGKLDSRQLPEPDMELILSEYEAPRNEIEETLAKIWSEVLGVKRIGINDNFFDLGGHSLKATALVSKIHKELNREIPLKELFRTPTIKELSKYIEKAEENIYSNIEKAEEKEYYEASSAQKRMYILQQFDKESTAYNMPAVFELKGKIDKNKIEETFRKLTQRHEALRTYFKTLDGEIIQKLQDSYELKLEHKTETENIEEIINNFVRPFELEKAPLFRAELAGDKEKAYLLVDMHHIISDGVSMSIITNEFAQLYNGKKPDELKLQYKDFAVWQNKFLKTEEIKKQEEYWINRFSDEIPILNMPTDYERPAVQSFEGDSVDFEISEEVTSKLRKLTKETGTTMHMALLSSFNILLSKYSGQEDIVIGTPIAGRPHADLENIMGMFVNTLALRNRPEGEKRYIDFLKEVKENSLKAYENQSYQFEELVEKLNIRRDTSRNPLFDVMFNMIDTVDGEDIKLEDIILKRYRSENKVSKFDLTLNVSDKGRKLSFTINYCSKLFKKETIERLSNHYIKLLNSIVSNVEIKLSEVDLLSEAEKNQILYKFNDTKADYPKDKTIHELFEAQAENTPDNIAVVFEEEKLTYKELNEKANSIARSLRDTGVKADSIVGIMVERSLEMIIGIMGILKAGGAYLPIDPSYPKERIQYMLEDSKSKILLSEESLLESIEFECIVIDLYKEELYKNDISNLIKINNSNNLAYVIYTSGSTGNPKGVMIEHKNVVNLLNYMQKKYPIDCDGVYLLKTNYVFDVSITELFGWFVGCGSLAIMSDNDQKDANAIIDSIDRYKVTHINFVPSMLSVFNEAIEEKLSKIKSLKYILSAGEELNVKLAEDLSDKIQETKLENLYGPTEASVYASMYSVNKNLNYRRIPIGAPTQNTSLYVLNNNSVMPIGVAGELCIAGEGVARGYLNKEELTKEKFVNNPFEPGTKMYKTGDLAKWTDDGNIEFLGRIDNQVKIRGFRIELGEIESRILQHEKVKEAAVVVKENKEKEKYICTYIVSENSLEELNLKNYLREILPEYMIPSYFVQIEKMPLTPNGKLDRKQLPEPDMELISSEYEAPRNEVEETLAKIWSEVLGVERVGINDNFFDLGGHSLKATILVSKIHKELSREIPLKELFRTPTIKELSRYIEKAEENIYSNIEKIEEKECYEASSAQKRMYILQQFDKESTAYNMPIVLELEGKIDKNKIEETFRKLAQRHEALRTYFETIDGEVVQKIQNDCEFKLEQREEQGNIEEIINNFVRLFELEKAPLFRVELVENKEKVYLLVDMHHIISDGVSMSIITNEFAQLYNGKKPDELKLQYKDFAEWQNKFLKTEEMKKQEEYWIKEFSDEIPVLNMPTDYNRPAMKSFEGDSISFEISEEITSKLRKLTKETGTTMHMALLSAFNILLSKYSEQEDMVIGTPIAGRPHADLENIVGMFVNTIALRNKPEGEKRYIDFLKEVKENSLKAYENQSYQLETLVEKLDIRRDTSRNPLFDVMFNIADTINNRGDIKLEDIILKSYNTGSRISKFDMTLNAIEGGVKVYFSIEYCTKLFKKETIERLSSHYIKLLDSIVDNVEIKLGEVDLLSEAEKNQILYEFNDTEADYPKDKTIHELFEAQAERTPDNIAVVFEEEKLTYKELNEKSNSLAKELREKGVKADSIVGIMTEKSLEMIIGIMGILKAGGAYLPIDPSYPKERIEYMLKDSETRILLSQESLLEGIEFEGIVIDLHKEELYKNDTSNLEKINTSNNLAYVIYTSGSTGNPKGVLVEHKSVIRLVKNTNYIEFKTNDKILQTGSMVFDASTFEVWGSLLNGLELHLAKNETIMMSQSLEELLIKNNISILWLTSELFNQMAETDINIFRGLRCLLVGGDILSPKYINAVREKFAGLKIINGYGPTENTTFSTTYLIKDISFNIPIGRPISNTKAYIVNKSNRLNPIGIYGELCLSGAGLARGYLNREELTKEKFVDNPFETGTKMYKTGDLARWLSDGKIEFLGRVDNQVKIRGFRIELGEIESRILQHEKVKEAVVLVKENKEKEKYICAYIVSENSLEELTLKNYLKEILPEYMIPSYFVQIEKMPLTSNGKLDRRQLPEPDMELMLSEYEAPRNEVEEILAKIWSEVLGVERVGINDNFFDLGGHSLKATIVVSRIHKELNVEVPIREMFKFPNIKGIGEYIKSIEKRIYSSIETVEEKEYYEASSAQKRMYLLQQFDAKSTVYNIPGVMMIEGKLEEERLKISFAELIRRHETLRTSFETIEDKVVQRVHESVDSKLDCFEVGIIENQEEAIESIVKDFVKVFDLNKSPLIRLGLIKLEEDKHILMFDMHHIISDGVSMEILINEFSKIYEGDELEQLRIQYKDFSEWQNSLLKSDIMQEQREYWINRFKDEIPVLNMPTDFQRPPIQSFEGENIDFKLDKELTKNLKRISKETGSTMYMVLLSGVYILLSKYSGQEDIIIGSPIAGRPHGDLERIIGMFVNTLAMRNYPYGSKTYENFLKEVKENSLKAYENQDYQFDDLVDKLSIPRDISRNPLFDVMFTMQNMDSKDIELKDLVFKRHKQETKIAKFDLTFLANEVKEEIIIQLQYSTKLYKREKMERMAEHFVNIIKAVTGDIKIKLSEIDMLTEVEKHKLLYDFNDTYADYPRDKTIQELFEEQVKKTPDNIAVVFEDKKLSYKELNERANKLARNLREKGVEPNCIVAIMVERSVEMIVGIMAILKAGAAYLPIDPEYPKDRIDYILCDSAANILLVQRKFIEKTNFDGDTIDLEDEKTYDHSGENLEKINTSSDLSYLIYTSGSTGMPKGVMIEHKTIINTLFWRVKYYKLSSEDASLQIPSFSFDSSVEDIFTPLLSGSKLILIRQDNKLDLQYIKTCIKNNNVGYMLLVPSFYKAMLKEIGDSLLSMKGITVAGESLGRELAIEHYEKLKDVQLYNEYGPTENSVCTSIYKIDKDNIDMLIGKPINNVKCYILGDNNELLPIGVEGELCISGEGLARGYLNRAELTNEKFVLNPFDPKERMYKTGDLTRWLPDGNIEFLGRIDHQVKIRGFRIELGEIESNLLTHEDVREAVIIDRKDEYGNNYLCAYLVSEQEIKVGKLTQHLSKKLPEYMIPSYFVQIDKIPLTPNGKIDRKSLPEPNKSIVPETEYEEARNEIEWKLSAIWSEVLGVEKVGINNNFFELGGHSLKAMILVSKIHKEFNIQISLSNLFNSPTIAELSELINNSTVLGYCEIEKLQQQDYYELSYAQKRLWIINQLKPDSIAYNMPGRITLFEKVDKNIIKKVFDNLAARHEAFRTMFKEIDGDPVQIINNEIDLNIETVDLSQLNNVEQIERREQIYAEQATKIFNLEISPLVYVKLVKIKEEEYDMIFTIHHIISDGSSMEILKREFALMYDSYKQGKEIDLEPLKIQYKDFAAWQNKLIRDEANSKAAKEFWLSQLSGKVKALNLPFSYESGNLKNNNSAGYRVIIKESHKNKLKELARENNTSLFVVLVTTFKFFLADLTGQKDILIGTAGFGRNHEDLKNIIGYFINTTILRNEIDIEESFVDILKRINANVLNALEYQHYPIELIIDELKISYPKISAFFNMLNMGESNSEYIEDFGTYAIEKVQDVKFDIVWYVTEYANGIEILCNYLLGLFEASRIESIMGGYVKMLDKILQNPNKSLKEFKEVAKKRKI